MTLAKNPRSRGGRKPSSPPPGEAKVVPLQPATPMDPRADLPDTQRETIVETLPNGIVLTTYMDAPDEDLGESLQLSFLPMPTGPFPIEEGPNVRDMSKNGAE